MDSGGSVIEGVRVERRGPVVDVVLQKADGYNAISYRMWCELPGLFAELGADPQVRGLVISGAGRMFSSGADISDFAQTRSTPEQVATYEEAVDRTCDAIAAVAKPVVAAIRGYCLGGACNIAMSADFRFIAPDAQMGIPAAKLSIVYSARGMARLAALVGLSQAKRIMYGGERFDAETALRTGFADQLDADPVAAAHAYLEGLAGNAPLSIAGSKLILNALALGEFDAHAAEAAADRAARSFDYAEGRAAFAAKRPPRFEGR
ncbi:MAG: enoyl-CoA hydratase-related protein [Phenylobacterium sp.]